MEKEIKGRKKGLIRQWMESASPGQYIYTTITQNNITAYSFHAKRKVKTEVCLVLSDYLTNPKVERVTKLTILE